MSVCTLMYIHYIYAVFTPNDGVMLLVHLEPARMGSLSYYLPILLLDEEVAEAGDNADAAAQD